MVSSSVRRWPSLGLAILLIVLMAPLAGPVLAAATVTTRADANVSADTAVSGSTTIPGPVITEGAAGDIVPGGELHLNAPANFAFVPGFGTASAQDAAGDCSITVSDLDVNSSSVSIDLGGTATTGGDRCRIAFSNLRVRLTNGTLPKSGDITISYTGGSSISGLSAGTSVGTLTGVPGAPILSFQTQPSSTAAAGEPFATQPVVRSADQLGNVRAGDVIALSITPGTGPSGATLTCDDTTVATNASGLAAFADCELDKAGTYRLRAGLTGATAVDSTTITVNPGPATKLGFVTQPARGIPNMPLAQQPQVAIQDAFGNTVTSASTTITLALSTNPGGALLTCTGGLSKATVNGVATFTGCRLDKVGVGYRITASAPGLTSATSDPFDVADRLAFTTQPANSTGGVPFPIQPVVAVRAGASATATNDDGTVVTLSIKAGTGAAGATLTCDGGLSKTVTDGVASFTGCRIDKASPAGNPYRLIASAPGLTSAESNNLTVSVGPATKLGFTAQPNAGVTGQPFPVQPVVAVQDAGGNTVTTGAASSATITLGIGANPGGGTLTCTGGLSKAAVNGVATFSGCRIDRAGNGYTLIASATGLTSATSAPFNVTLPQAQITLANSARVITWGGSVTLFIQFGANGANKTFELQGARDGVGWARIATLTTNASGFASFTYRPATNLYYRAVFGGSADLGAGTSNVVRTVVRQIALLRPTNLGEVDRIARGTSILFTVTVRPARPELPPARVTFVAYRLVAGRWTLVAERESFIDATGRAFFAWRFSSVGEWYVRAIARPTPFNANSVWSPVERYSVR
ncbi:MAG TPA: hypothetical protein VNJ28_05990 [Candidatus Limnocylindrales bacterium]|nr:hypothetical protein [Candidatus Limnocylindrales bacterium]